MLPALMTFVMLALTLSLGFWQLRRLQWKEALLAEISAGEHKPSVILTEDPPPFARVTVEGTYASATARYGAEVRSTPGGAVMGSHVISPLLRPGKPTILVDRGWAPNEWTWAYRPDVINVEGYVRPQEMATWSAATDDPVRGRFFTLDPIAIGSALGLKDVLPFTLVLVGSSPELPQPASHLPTPPNDHLSYAVTWFSLSIVLVVVFGLFLRKTLKRPLTK